jgi:hypothetical protein
MLFAVYQHYGQNVSEDERDKNIRVFLRKQAIFDVKNLVCLKCSLFFNRIKKQMNQVLL